MNRDLLFFTLDRIPGLKSGEKILIAEVYSSGWDGQSSVNPVSHGENILFHPDKSCRDKLALSRHGIESIICRKLKNSWNLSQWEEAGRRDWEVCHASGIEYTLYTSPDYPPQLREIFDPPLIMYYRGTLPDYDKPMLGVVGTRYPTGRGRNEAFRTGLVMGSRGVAVVSGLARGIDLAAHLGNISSGGRTVAVLAGGLDRVYPQMNEDTARRILKSGGCLLSEYPPGTLPRKYHFPARNRIVSGLSRSVVVIEAPAKSGALITADFAAEQGRDLWVHDVNMESPCGAGGRRLLDDGATLFDKAEEILVEWWDYSLSYEKALIKNREKNVGERSALLMEKELEGELVQYQGEYFRRIR
ncbi:MAG: DNA-protecting protein DprA [Spirochaetales bacterium]|nr:DNA-protecting protein DprA [Spirochaetales bacterium]